MRSVSCFLSLLLGLALNGPAWASPGAHGPNGEHLDGPPSAQAGAGQRPRFEAHSELFEIVGQLGSGELLLFINRYESNEAVLGAKVELELGSAKAAAVYRAEQGAYAFADRALLAALARPGRHALVFTVTAGGETDLLDGSLPIAAQDTQHNAEPAGLVRAGYGAAALLGLVAVGIAGLRMVRQRARRSNTFGAAR